MGVKKAEETKYVYIAKDDDGNSAEGSSVKEAYQEFNREHGGYDEFVNPDNLTFYKAEVVEVEFQIVEKPVPVVVG